LAFGDQALQQIQMFLDRQHSHTPVCWRRVRPVISPLGANRTVTAEKYNRKLRGCGRNVAQTAVANGNETAGLSPIKLTRNLAQCRVALSAFPWMMANVVAVYIAHALPSSSFMPS